MNPLHAKITLKGVLVKVGKRRGLTIKNSGLAEISIKECIQFINFLVGFKNINRYL